jgi:predicted phage terminase large subunit-like protein
MMDYDAVPREKLEELARLLEAKKILDARENFLPFVKQVWPEFICREAKEPSEWGHHQIIADRLTKVAQGKLKRLIVNMPPRHTKSEFASVFFPAWIMGLKPDAKIMQVSHNAELSQRFGRKVRNLVSSEDYSKVFKNVSLAQDSKASGRWETNHGGEYFAAGVGGAITGRGADILIIDDPHTEQNVMSGTAMEKTYDWYVSGPRQRLQPGGAIVVVMTRWATNDLTGKLIDHQKNDNADQWEVIHFPALMPSGEPVWPEYWKKSELEAVKASLPPQRWNAQYMQNPTSEEGALVKREWWRPWRGDIPNLSFVIQSYDTAYSKKETADYSAITTWGVFCPEEGGDPAIILVDAMRGRYDFPDLKNVALEQYKYWQPEAVVIEAKATGQPLLQEFRRMGIPVMDFTPTRGKDKFTRLNSVAPLFASGMVYYPEGEQFALDVIEEVAAFPNGEHDDYVDSMTQAMLRYRQGSFVSADFDEMVEAKERLTMEHTYYG